MLNVFRFRLNQIRFMCPVAERGEVMRRYCEQCRLSQAGRENSELNQDGESSRESWCAHCLGGQAHRTRGDNTQRGAAIKSGMMKAALMIGAAMLFAACGGGGDSPSGATPAAGAGSTTITGTAAGGAPLIGTVTVKDSKGVERSKNIDLASAGGL